VDEDVDIEDPSAMEWAMATRFQADRDLVVMAQQKGSSLDPSSDQSTRETAKAGFDLTISFPERRKMFTRVEPQIRIELDDYLE
jgi:2,5-furandicarboxylate decarboxylase 1